MENICKLRFVVIGYEFERDLFPRILNVEPTRFRTRDNWPDHIKNNKHLPERTYFEYEIERRNIEYTDVLFDEMFEVLHEHSDKLNKVKDELNLHYSFILSVHTNRDSFPHIDIVSKFSTVLSKLNTDLVLDIYFDIEEVEDWDYGYLSK